MGSKLRGESVGPVLTVGVVADAVIAAIQETNADVVVVAHGSYSRVLVPARCAVSRADVERHLGRPLRFPRELEKVMPSFKGAFRVTEERAEWVSREPGQPDRHDNESVEIEN